MRDSLVAAAVMPTRPSLQADGVLLDLDGTLYDVDKAIAGAPQTVVQLRRAGIPFRFVTNTSRMSRREVREHLQGLGIETELEELFTTTVGAASWLVGHGIERVALCLPKATREDFGHLTIDEDSPEAVVVGDLGYEWSFGLLNRAFRWLNGGAILVATHRNRYWRTADGITLDAGPFIVALEYATGRQATTVGKPNPEFFQLSAQSMALSPRDVVMVGDDLENDIVGIQNVGGRGILVRTGKFQETDLTDPDIQPDMVVNSIADLPGVLLG
ncbi:MAG: TIGR01458 family HAD-type hydrolase [Gemmatimonadota bacterium]|nr:MAG: TIGR01458 family HAD-type hydrolase [Gemmatimonadota bacterium]